MVCPRCAGFASSNKCGSCGWHEGDVLPTDATELRRAEVLLYLKAYRRDLAELFGSGRSVQDAVDERISQMAAQVVAQVDNAHDPGSGI